MFPFQVCIGTPAFYSCAYLGMRIPLWISLFLGWCMHIRTWFPSPTLAPVPARLGHILQLYIAKSGGLWLYMATFFTAYSSSCPTFLLHEIIMIINYKWKSWLQTLELWAHIRIKCLIIDDLIDSATTAWSQIICILYQIIWQLDWIMSNYSSDLLTALWFRIWFAVECRLCRNNWLSNRTIKELFPQA